MKQIPWLPTLSFLGLLALGMGALSCGSGGGGGGTPSPNPPTPVLTFTTQPAHATHLVDQTATFTVAATGTPTPTFQWERSSDGSTWSAISGATSATYTFTVQAGDHNAQFRAQASNSTGKLASSAAKLSVNVAPNITTQPQSQTRSIGRSVTLSVEATANGTLSYQWRKDDKELPGETAATLMRQTLSSADAGTYDVVITSTLGGTTVSTTSEKAELRLVPLPTITRFKAARQWLMAGQSTTLDVEYTGGNGTLDHALGPVDSGTSVSTGVISQATKYTLTVTNAAGDSVTAQAPIYGPSSIATGGNHTLALKEDGTVWAWGSNGAGQLGDGTTIVHGSPASVKGLTDVVALSAKGDYNLAVKRDGTVWRWGQNHSGNDSHPELNVPSQIDGLSDIAAVVAAGLYEKHWAFKTDGSVWSFTSWGRPEQNKDFHHVSAFAMGGGHSLAVMDDGQVWAWGSNAYGQLGDGTTTDSSAAVMVKQLTNVVAVSAGDRFSLALKADGTLWAWGQNANGQLGDGSIIDRSTPVKVQQLTDVVALCAGPSFSLACKADGTLWSWGENTHGQLGDGTTSPTKAPQQVLEIGDVVGIAAGPAHALALRSDGSLWAWGDSKYGLLGDGQAIERLNPTKMVALNNITSIRSGIAHVLAQTTDGGVYAWGYNQYGQIGQGMSTAHPTYSLPQNIPTLQGAKALAAGGFHNLAVISDGSVLGWGFNDAAQLGTTENPFSHAPVAVAGLPAISALSCSFKTSLFLDEKARVWWCGSASAQVKETVPTLVEDLPEVKAISAGYYHGLALNRDGRVWAFGGNTYDQLGVSSSSMQDSAKPLLVSGLPTIASIQAGYTSNAAIDDEGRVWTWGRGAESRTGEFHAPSQVPGLSGITAVACGYGHFLALKQDGTVWSWGANTSGVLGDGTKNDRSVPAPVPGLKNVTQIAAGDAFSMALATDGLYVWGSDYSGQLGLGRMTHSLTPYQVPNFKLW